ncbi:MAG: hypothetical protein IT440_06410 [Phycisphaeraceae bacterium]|nr:hypothetical protein [Phycisphaeraceae bacterium]
MTESIDRSYWRPWLRSQMRLHWRMTLILVVGLTAIGLATRYRQSQRPTPAPASVQAQGLARVSQVINRLRQTPWGNTLRGDTILTKLEQLRDARRIVFATHMDSLGITYKEYTGNVTIYIRVFRADDQTYAVPSNILLADTLCHETVHALHPLHRTTFNEECDAFLAGLDAQSSYCGWNPLHMPTVEDDSVAEFIRRKYPGIPTETDYRPVAAEWSWVRQRAGLSRSVVMP